jgi:predicted enzyme related to lactoylglutathione lyase
MTSMSAPSLSLLTLRSSNTETTLSFYRALGFDFVEEQHGTGPRHHSSKAGATVLEIYPGEPGTAPERKSAGATLIGFGVADLDHMLSSLTQLGAPVLTPARQSPWGRRAVVADPDGRAIDLSELSLS